MNIGDCSYLVITKYQLSVSAPGYEPVLRNVTIPEGNAVQISSLVILHTRRMLLMLLGAMPSLLNQPRVLAISKWLQLLLLMKLHHKEQFLVQSSFLQIQLLRQPKVKQASFWYHSSPSWQF